MFGKIQSINKLRSHRVRQAVSGNRGFSLLELIIAIAILVILTGLIAPNVLRYVEKSRASADFNDADAIAESLKLWMADPDNTKRLSINADNVCLLVVVQKIPEGSKAKPYDTAICNESGGSRSVWNSDYKAVHIGTMVQGKGGTGDSANRLKVFETYLTSTPVIRQNWPAYAVLINGKGQTGYLRLSKVSGGGGAQSASSSEEAAQIFLRNPDKCWNVEGVMK